MMIGLFSIHHRKLHFKLPWGGSVLEDQTSPLQTHIIRPAYTRNEFTRCAQAREATTQLCVGESLCGHALHRKMHAKIKGTEMCRGEHKLTKSHE